MKKNVSSSFRLTPGVSSALRVVARTLRLSKAELTEQVITAFCAQAERRTSAVRGLSMERLPGSPLDGLAYVVNGKDGEPVAKFANPNDAALFIAAYTFNSKQMEVAE